MKPMYVICFYWEGERWHSHPNISNSTDPQYRRMLEKGGSVSLELASRYVNNLFRGVTRFAQRNFKFICFTNENLPNLDNGVEIRKFDMLTHRGVLPRIYMFSEKAGLGDQQVLCIDLDVVVVGDMEPLMSYHGKFCARSKFKPGEEWKLDGDVMSFRAGEEADRLFWKPFAENVGEVVARTQGRERYWIREVANDFADRWDTIAPGAVLSYKRHLMHRHNLPPNASLVSCHGVPRPHQIRVDWIKDYWE